MRTILDGGIDCFSQSIQLANSGQQVRLRFKRKVLDVLKQRHFLKQQRRAAAVCTLANSGQPKPKPKQQQQQQQQQQRQKRRSSLVTRGPQLEAARRHELETSERRAAAAAGRRLIKGSNKNEHDQHEQADEMAERLRQVDGASRTRAQVGEKTNTQKTPEEASLERRHSSWLEQERPQHLGQFQANVRLANEQKFRLGSPMLAPQRPKVLPNNTQLEDLCKCHHNLMPKVSRASARTLELLSSCLPTWFSRRRPGQVREKKLANKTGSSKLASTTAAYQSDYHNHEDDNPETGAGRNKDETIYKLDEDEDEDDDQVENRQNDKGEQNVAHTIRTPRSKVAPARMAPPSPRARRKLKFQVPESLFRLNTSLQPEEYDRALSTLTSDVRYQLHLLLYGRLSTIWTLFSSFLCILVPLLCLATIEPVALVGLCLGWLGLQLLGALITRQFCAKLNQMLEKAVAQVNSYLMDHNLMLGVINVGGLFVRARLVIPLLYFDTSQCREQIESIISADLRKRSEPDEPGDNENKAANKLGAELAASGRKWPLETMEERKLALNYSKIGLSSIGPENQMSFAQSQLAKKIVLRYSQRWISFYDKQRLMFADDTAKARHLSTGKCLCQFIEEHFKCADFGPAPDQPDGTKADAAGGAALQPAHHHHVIPTSDSKQLNRAQAQAQVGSQQWWRPSEPASVGAPSQQTNGAPVCLQANELQPGEWRKSCSPPGSFYQSNSHSHSHSNSSNHHNHHNQFHLDLSLRQQLDLLVPTLSQLVNLREQQQQQPRMNLERMNSCEFGSYASSSKLLHSFASQLQQERQESNSSPSTENSLDLTEASVESLGSSSRNEELIKRLKLLLDSRKDQFSRGLDGSGSFQPTSGAHNQNQNQQQQQHQQHHLHASRPATIISEQSLSEHRRYYSSNQSGSSHTIDMQDEPAVQANASPISQIGRRFFSQTDGFFFLGTRKSQQGVYGKQQQQQRHILEIC